MTVENHPLHHATAISGYFQKCESYSLLFPDRRILYRAGMRICSESPDIILCVTMVDVAVYTSLELRETKYCSNLIVIAKLTSRCIPVGALVLRYMHRISNT